MNRKESESVREAPSPLSSFWFNSRGEFRIYTLYFPAVLFHCILLNWHTPVLEVIWDSVYYKHLAYGLHHFSTFDLSRHFPVPPLYPLVISPAFFAKDYLTVEFIQNCLNPFLYFLSLFPLYALCRLILPPIASALGCVLFILYPSAIYAQWTMSENLAIPLTLLVVYLGAREIVKGNGSSRDGMNLGLAIAAMILTRIPSFFLGITLLLWLSYRKYKRGLSQKPLVEAWIAAASTLLLFYWSLGYFFGQADSPIYTEFDLLPSDTLFGFITHWISLIFAHLSALWLEGSLLITTLALVQFLRVAFDRTFTTIEQWEIAIYLIFLAVMVIVSVSLFLVFRSLHEPWSVSLRYTCYANLFCLPLALWAIEDTLKAKSNRNELFQFYLVSSLFLAIGFLLPGVWSGLSRVSTFYANAPSLDVFNQIRGEGPWIGILLFLVISATIYALFLWRYRLGLLLLVLLMLYVQGSSLEYLMKRRASILYYLGIEDIHVFCKQIQAGLWRDMPIYTQMDEYVTYLGPNLSFWVNKPSIPLLEDDSMPPPPFLYLTFREIKTGEILFQSGHLRAYLLEESDGEAMRNHFK